MKRRWIGVLGALAAVTLAGCASDWQERYELSSRENKDLVDQMNEVRSSQASEAARAEAAAAAAKALERENEKMLAERNEAAKRAQEYKALYESGLQSKPAAPATGSASDKALSDWRKVYGESGTVRLDENGNIEITLPSDVGFASGSEVLNDSGKKALRSLAGKLNGEFASARIRVVGYTDNEPLRVTKEKYGDNLGLSTARANTVLRYMQDDLRIDPSRLTSAGRGEQNPVADNKTASGKAKNRRVEIVVVTGVQAK